jgi:integrator complex subunit 11
MLPIRVVPLGAGQDVGRSCILLTIGGKNVLLDSGMHMGFEDARRFPDFSHIGTGDLTNVLDAVVVSHFHLDHCGSLPVLTELVGYRGPVYMTHPTRAICPVLLEDFRKIAVERRGESNFFTSQNIRDCMSKVIPLSLQQRVVVDGTLEITAFYAGHVLGAAMFEIRVGAQSVVYTGDYNMTPDRHLGAAWIGKVRPDLLITESTYCTFVRDSKRVREKEFLARLHAAVERGGKVLIPVFALGRVQELCILVETYWQRMNLGHVPVYFTAGMAARATEYYRLFVNWTNQKIKESFVERNMFDFQHIKPFDASYASNPGPMVLFATPGMLHAGTSLEVFKKWAGNPLNMVLIPGYCSAGTVGATLLAGKHKQQRIEVDKKTFLDVRCQVEYLSFSAHADAAGIEELIRMCEPRNVMLVHGEKHRISEFKRKVVRDFGVPCFDPANGTTVTIQTPLVVPALFSTALVKEKRERGGDYYAAERKPGEKSEAEEDALKRLRMAAPVPVQARVEVAESGRALLFVPCEQSVAAAEQEIVHEVTLGVSKAAAKTLLARLQQGLGDELDCQVALVGARELHARSLSVVLLQDGNVSVTWNVQDDVIARKTLSLIA